MSNKTPKANAAKTASALRYKRFLLVLLSVVLLLVFLFVIQTRRAGEQLKLGSQSFSYEIARTQIEQEKGLSDRSSLGKNSAMLFAFDQPAVECFWMKDMRFSLDMIWLNENKQIIHIEQNVQPDTYPQSFCPSSPAKYVIEVNAGTVGLTHLNLGDQVSF